MLTLQLEKLLADWTVPSLLLPLRFGEEEITQDRVKTEFSWSPPPPPEAEEDDEEPPPPPTQEELDVSADVEAGSLLFILMS